MTSRLGTGAASSRLLRAVGDVLLGIGGAIDGGANEEKGGIDGWATFLLGEISELIALFNCRSSSRILTSG